MLTGGGGCTLPLPSSIALSAPSLHTGSKLPSPHPYQNFYLGATSVTIGAAPCTSVEVTDGMGLGSLSCTAPSGPGIGDVRLQVAVAGGGNASVPFLYEAPSVMAVNLAACAADANVAILVYGTNLGLRNSATSPDPVVYIGDSLCFQPLLLNSTAVQCTALASAVGEYSVTSESPGGWVDRGRGGGGGGGGSTVSSGPGSGDPCRAMPTAFSLLALALVCAPRRPGTSVALNGKNSTNSVTLHRLCGAGKFALPGASCGDCPQVRVRARKKGTRAQI
jgi:hypothetical protein